MHEKVNIHAEMSFKENELGNTTPTKQIQYQFF